MASYTPPKAGSKIIIVGGGCYGLSTAYTLSSDKDKNYVVWVYDRGSSIPVRDAASTDISKAVRMDYGKDQLCTKLAIESIQAWKEWNKERQEHGLDRVFHNTGLLIFSGTNECTENELVSIEQIRSLCGQDEIEELTPDEIVSRFPFFETAVKSSGNGYAYYNKQGGWCNSSEAIKHVYKKCIANGVHFVLGDQGHFTELVTEGRSVTGIKTKDGSIHKSDRVIMCTGPWTSSLIDMHKQVIATGQVVIHFKPPKEIQETLKNLPVWFGGYESGGYYGFPDNNGILKVAKHSTGYLNPRASDNVSVPRTDEGDKIPEQALSEFREFLRKFLPITDDLDVVYSRVCWYSDSIDGQFMIGAHPDFDDLIVAAGDSGHAMKFLPVIGSKIADAIENRDTEYTRAWKWRKVLPRSGFYDRPLLT